MRGAWGWGDSEDGEGVLSFTSEIDCSMSKFACFKCPANTDNGCNLLTHYEDSEHTGSYDIDNNNRMLS